MVYHHFFALSIGYSRVYRIPNSWSNSFAPLVSTPPLALPDCAVLSTSQILRIIHQWKNSLRKSPNSCPCTLHIDPLNLRKQINPQGSMFGHGRSKRPSRKIASNWGRVVKVGIKHLQIDANEPFYNHPKPKDPWIPLKFNQFNHQNGWRMRTASCPKPYPFPQPGRGCWASPPPWPIAWPSHSLAWKAPVKHEERDHQWDICIYIHIIIYSQNGKWEDWYNNGIIRGTLSWLLATWILFTQHLAIKSWEKCHHWIHWISGHHILKEKWIQTVIVIGGSQKKTRF